MAKQGGYGVKFKITVSSALTAVANVLDVDFPKFQREIDDVTGHDSSGGYAEYISTGLKSLSEMKLMLTWDKAAATHAAIKTAFDSGGAVNMSVEDPGGSEIIAFAGIIKEMGRTSKQKEALKCEVTIQPTGAPTITP